MRDFIASIVNSDFDAARAFSKDLVKFLPSGQLRHALLRLVNERGASIASSGLCFTAASRELVMARCLDEAASLRELSGNHETLVLVDVEDARYGQSWCSREVGGFAYVKLASGDIKRDPSVIRHELAHAWYSHGTGSLTKDSPRPPSAAKFTAGRRLHRRDRPCVLCYSTAAMRFPVSIGRCPRLRAKYGMLRRTLSDIWAIGCAGRSWRRT